MMPMIQIDTEKYNQEELINDLKNNTIETVLQKHNLTWRELIYIQTQKNLKEDRNIDNMTRTKKNTYRVNKVIDKKIVNYGEYKTKEEAKTIVNEMRKHYWNKEQLPIIKQKHNIKDIKD